MEIEDVRKGTKFLIDGVAHRVEEAEFVKPGKGQALYRLKLRNLITNSLTNRTYRSGDKVDEVHTETYKVQYLYQDGSNYVFMDTGTFEQHFIDEAKLGERKVFLKEGTVVNVTMLDTEPLDIELPNFVELKVVRSTITAKTDTVTAQYKPVELETGATVNAPVFVQEGDILKVDTRTGTYVERVSGKK